MSSNEQASKFLQIIQQLQTDGARMRVLMAKAPNGMTLYEIQEMMNLSDKVDQHLNEVLLLGETLPVSRELTEQIGEFKKSLIILKEKSEALGNTKIKIAGSAISNTTSCIVM